jgi:signal transduction histidine kinase
MRRAALVAAACAGGTLLAADAAAAAAHGGDAQTAVALAAEAVALAAAWVLWARRPDSRVGALMAAWLAVAIAGDLAGWYPGYRLGATGMWLLPQLAPAVFAQLVLAYPSGRLRGRVERAFVAAAYAVECARALPPLLFASSATCGCSTLATSYLFLEPRDWTTAGRIATGAVAAAGVVFVGLVVRRIRRAGRGARRTLWPLVVAAAFAAAQLVVRMAAVAADWRRAPWRLLDWTDALAPAAVALALAVGVAATRRARGVVADLVVELSRTPPGGVREALARAVGDPTLELALWLPERRAWVDGAGRGLELPTGGDRAVTMLGVELAAIVHDPALCDQRPLLEAAGHAARLALENERLQAELRAQLAELRASRARIVEAADAERRRLERDLHDGAQQRLLGLGIALQLVRARVRDDEAEALLVEVEAELRAALAELRDLARGIHPAILVDEGLAAAVRTLAERAPLPLELDLLDERLPPAVETAAYYVVTEALANVARYARARRGSVRVARLNGSVVVEVRDDGAGGADPRRGTGLAGLADRVGALDGRLRIESPLGGGTEIVAEFPCG